jgi:hypothetical protein
MFKKGFLKLASFDGGGQWGLNSWPFASWTSLEPNLSPPPDFFALVIFGIGSPVFVGGVGEEKVSLRRQSSYLCLPCS